MWLLFDSWLPVMWLRQRRRNRGNNNSLQRRADAGCKQRMFFVQGDILLRRVFLGVQRPPPLIFLGAVQPLQNTQSSCTLSPKSDTLNPELKTRNNSSKSEPLTFNVNSLEGPMLGHSCVHGFLKGCRHASYVFVCQFQVREGFRV